MTDPITTIIVPNGWTSPNRLMRNNWASIRHEKRVIYDQVIAHKMAMMPEERDICCLSEPRKRRLFLTVVGKRAIDPDNLVGGCKLVIDSLRKVRRVRVKIGETPKGQRRTKTIDVDNGPGFIWDDSPEFLELEVVHERHVDSYRGQQRFVMIDVYETT